MRDNSALLEIAEIEISKRLEIMLAEGRLTQNYYDDAKHSVLSNLRSWMEDPEIDRLSPNLKPGLGDAIEGKRWEDLINAFLRTVNFGTGGIRQVMAFRKEEITTCAEVGGVDARILKGPNTINNITILTCAAGVAKFFTSSDPARECSAVVGFDSRIQGEEFARAIAEVLLAEGMRVYLFDEAVPYPEVTFAIPNLGADVGIFISASHNDYRYNGFKLSGPNGAQIPPDVRDEILKDYIQTTKPADIRPVALTPGESLLERLEFLGGDAPLEGVDYVGREGSLIDMHSRHTRHVEGFLLRRDELRDSGAIASLKIAFAAFNGSGRRAVPRLLRELGFTDVHSITSLDPLDGRFPAFKSDPGEEQQPDPGDPRAAVIALREFDEDVAAGLAPLDWNNVDMLIGTDPDADRCGVVVKPSPDFAKALPFAPPTLRYSDRHVLISADELWSLLLWYRLRFEVETLGGVQDPERKFIALSHTTSDMICRVAEQFGLGVLKTWVGFGWLSAGVERVWRGEALPVITEGQRSGTPPGPADPIFYDTSALGEDRSVNVGALEQSNGFSILGRPPVGFPAVDRDMGQDGHVRDKDGTLAALLMAEVAAYAKQEGSDLLTLIERNLYADEQIGLFVNYYEPDPLDGEYPGIEGDSKKKRVLGEVMDLYARAETGGLTFLEGADALTVTDAKIYATGKYDEINYPGFPDEGVRFYFGGPLDHLTIRPSGTSNALRFHVQFFGGTVEGEAAWQKRFSLESSARNLVTEIRKRVGAERVPGVEF